MTRIHIIVAALLALGCRTGGGEGRPDATDTTCETDVLDEAEDGDTVVPETECALDTDCDDADPCTVDTCDPDFERCTHQPVDGDGDGYPAMEMGGVTCDGGSDCADDEADVHPGAAPDCSGTEDRDCDGMSDPDEDGDGYVTTGCGGDDCNDADPDAFPGSLELDCGLDRDCNGHTDADNDGDGYDSPDCGGTDCDDARVYVNPGASELNCNGMDDDCSGDMSSMEDADQDGYANFACSAAGAVTDCDDEDDTIFPGAATTCDTVDDDCSGSWQDESGSDDDGDGHLDDACGGDDCDDTAPDVHPGAPEQCPDGIDHDCDGAPHCHGWETCGASSGLCEIPFVTMGPGTFSMGSPESQAGHGWNEAEHEVTLTGSFEIMATEVTQGQFGALMSYNPSHFATCGMGCPVETLTWSEAAAYANAFSVEAGLATCYTCSGSGDAVTCELDATYGTPYECPGYRLPTESEWEYAARAGTTDATYNGTTTLLGYDSCLNPNPILDPIAWFCGNGLNTTHEASMKDPNPWGLVDMLGNVWEWCHDWYENPLSGPVDDPWGPAVGTQRVVRGGGFDGSSDFARAACRAPKGLLYRTERTGFRLARSLP